MNPRRTTKTVRERRATVRYAADRAEILLRERLLQAGVGSSSVGAQTENSDSESDGFLVKSSSQSQELPDGRSNSVQSSNPDLGLPTSKTVKFGLGITGKHFLDLGEVDMKYSFDEIDNGDADNFPPDHDERRHESSKMHSGESVEFMKGKVQSQKSQKPSNKSILSYETRPPVWKRKASVARTKNKLQNHEEQLDVSFPEPGLRRKRKVVKQRNSLEPKRNINSLSHCLEALSSKPRPRASKRKRLLTRQSSSQTKTSKRMDRSSSSLISSLQVFNNHKSGEDSRNPSNYNGVDIEEYSSSEPECGVASVPTFIMTQISKQESQKQSQSKPHVHDFPQEIPSNDWIKHISEKVAVSPDASWKSQQSHTPLNKQNAPTVSGSSTKRSSVRSRSRSSRTLIGGSRPTLLAQYTNATRISMGNQIHELGLQTTDRENSTSLYVESCKLVGHLYMLKSVCLQNIVTDSENVPRGSQILCYIMATAPLERQSYGFAEQYAYIERMGHLEGVRQASDLVGSQILLSKPWYLSKASTSTTSDLLGRGGMSPCISSYGHVIVTRSLVQVEKFHATLPCELQKAFHTVDEMKTEKRIDSESREGETDQHLKESETENVPYIGETLIQVTGRVLSILNRGLRSPRQGDDKQSLSPLETSHEELLSSCTSLILLEGNSNDRSYIQLQIPVTLSAKWLDILTNGIGKSITVSFLKYFGKGCQRIAPSTMNPAVAKDHSIKECCWPNLAVGAELQCYEVTPDSTIDIYSMEGRSTPNTSNVVDVVQQLLPEEVKGLTKSTKKRMSILCQVVLVSADSNGNAGSSVTEGLLARHSPTQPNHASMYVVDLLKADGDFGSKFGTAIHLMDTPLAAMVLKTCKAGDILMVSNALLQVLSLEVYNTSKYILARFSADWATSIEKVQLNSANAKLNIEASRGPCNQVAFIDNVGRVITEAEWQRSSSKFAMVAADSFEVIPLLVRDMDLAIWNLPEIKKIDLDSFEISSNPSSLTPDVGLYCFEGELVGALPNSSEAGDLYIKTEQNNVYVRLPRAAGEISERNTFSVVQYNVVVLGSEIVAAKKKLLSNVSGVICINAKHFFLTH